MATDAPPVPQHLAALARANWIRLARAELKRRVFAGDVDVLVILSPGHSPGVRRLEPVPELVESLPVNELLGWPPRWGTVRTRRLLEDVGIRENAPLGALTDRQRWKIIAALTGEADPFTAKSAAPRRELGPLDVECPHCRSAVGDPCSWYDPVQDHWIEPKTPCRERVERAGLLS